MRALVLVGGLILVACSGASQGATDSGTDAGCDAGRDAASTDAGVDAQPMDAGHDSGSADAGYDAGQDAGTDAGPTCECASGPCCDGCHFRSASYVCATNVVTSVSCVSASVCSGYGLTLRTRRADRRCPGWASTCTGTYGLETATDVDCDSSQGFPTYPRCVDPGSNLAYCTWGPNCSTEHP